MPSDVRPSRPPLWRLPPLPPRRPLRLSPLQAPIRLTPRRGIMPVKKPTPPPARCCSPPLRPPTLPCHPCRCSSLWMTTCTSQACGESTSPSPGTVRALFTSLNPSAVPLGAVPVISIVLSNLPASGAATRASVLTHPPRRRRDQMVRHMWFSGCRRRWPWQRSATPSAPRRSGCQARRWNVRPPSLSKPPSLGPSVCPTGHVMLGP